MYFSGMQLNDGKGVYPFTDDCERFENGGAIDQRANAAGADPARPENRVHLLGPVELHASSSSQA